MCEKNHCVRWLVLILCEREILLAECNEDAANRVNDNTLAKFHFQTSIPITGTVLWHTDWIVRIGQASIINLLIVVSPVGNRFPTLHMARAL